MNLWYFPIPRPYLPNGKEVAQAMAKDLAKRVHGHPAEQRVRHPRQLTHQAVFGRDYPVIQAVVRYGAALTVAVNLVVDLLYAVHDPGVRY
ncbi:hypothetical protein [Amycolatopsis kentuckyensis]|uniref:hypothetical protein n=1 Tax=Amycolatopsis kentuckyensis TaxID=218823 RepID=UPI0035657A32